VWNPQSDNGKAKPAEGEKRVHSNTKSDSYEMVQCPECTLRLLRDKLDMHLHNFHSSGKKTEKVISRETLRPVEIRKAGPKSDEDEKTFNSFSALDPNEMVQCPECPSKVRRDRLENHLCNVHGPGKKTKKRLPSKTLRSIATRKTSPARTTIIKNASPTVSRGCPGCGALHGCYCR
jgi:hypothetical protein